MPQVTRYTPSWNLKTLNNRTLNKKVPYKFFDDSSLSVISTTGIEVNFYSKNDVLLFRIPANTKETLLNSVEFTHDFKGSADLVLKLLDNTPYPLIYGSKIKIKIGGKTFYTGYLFKPQSEFNAKKGLFEYKFFGLRKRYEGQEIVLPTYNITSITKSGDDVYYYSSTPIPSSVITNQRIGVRRTDNKANNGYYLIQQRGTNWVKITNHFGVDQTTAGGDFNILPYVWSNPAPISEVFKALAQMAASSFSIGYNAAKIEYSTGHLTSGMVDFDGMDYEKAIESLEKMSLNFATMGVDNEGEFFFKLTPEEPVTVLNTGYEINDPGLSLNYNNLANIITGERTKERGATGNGFEVAAVAEPLEDVNLSIAKYGKYTKRVKVPGYLSDAVIQQIVNSDLQANKEPRFSSKIENVKFDRFWSLGDYAICPLPDVYTDIVSECDSLTNWTHDTNVTLAVNTNVMISGNGSLQINGTPLSSSESFELSVDYDLTGKTTLEMWMQSNRSGDYLTVSITDGVTTENYPLSITTINQFFRVVIDIKNSALNKLTEIKFTFGTLTQNLLMYFDEIAIKRFTAKHQRLPFKKAIYKLSAHKGSVNLEFGLEGEKLSEFLAAIQTQTEYNNIASRNK